MLLRRNIPQFLQADTVHLRLAILVECKLWFDQLRKMTTHAFGKECIFRMQFHATHIIVFMAAIARNAHVTGGDTPN